MINESLKSLSDVPSTLYSDIVAHSLVTKRNYLTSPMTAPLSRQV